MTIPKEHLEKSVKLLLDTYDDCLDKRDLIYYAREILGLVHMICDVGCPDCNGTGYKVYGSSATWKGGIGGQTITTDVCDSCWGSGRNDIKFGDLRKLKILLSNMEKKL